MPQVGIWPQDFHHVFSEYLEQAAQAPRRGAPIMSSLFGNLSGPIFVSLDTYTYIYINMYN